MKVLYLIVLSMTFLEVKGHNDSLCEDGWKNYGDNCYQIQPEYELPWDAFTTCSLMGGELAHIGYKEKNIDITMEFLTQLVADQAIYGGWVLRWTPGLPTHKQFTAPSNGCVGLVSQRDRDELMTAMVSAPCNIKLPYICIGHQGKVPQDLLHYAKHSYSEAYWFSSSSDRMSYDDAKAACRMMSLQLVSIRDQAQKNFISHQIRSRSNGNVDPWWIGLDVNNGVYSWSDGSSMQTGLLNWDPYAKYTYRVSGDICALLLYDQTWERRRCSVTRAPFICMKPLKSQADTGCPDKWVRYGHSCYRKPVPFQAGINSQRTCAKVGSHLVSVDTLGEKQLLMDMTRATLEIWVSLNDKKQKGSYVWADGSKSSPSIVKWDEPIVGSGKCVTYSPNTNYLKRHGCGYKVLFVGCQYAAPKGNCVSKNWVPYNGNCYFLPTNPRAYTLRNGTKLNIVVKGDDQLKTCKTILGQYDQSIEVMPLKLDSKEIKAKYDARLSGFYEIGVGVRYTKRGEPPLWDDGTPLDLSIFANRKQPYSGTQLEPRDCVIMNAEGYFFTASCYKDVAVTTCEKDAVSTPTPST